jgi:hypothetical protein
VESFYPGNCLHVTDLLLRDTPERRDEGAAQLELIELLAPRLLQLPFNPLPFRRRVKEALLDFLRRKPRKSVAKPELQTS